MSAFAAPVVAGIGLAATFGAGVTAQLGAMRISEEIDALEAMAIRPISYLVSTRIVAGMLAITPLYSIAVILSFLASQFTTVVLFGQSGGLYNHYFDTFLNPIDLLWSFLQAILMALAVLLLHTYYGYFASGGPEGVGRRNGQCGPYLAHRRDIGNAAGFAVHLRLQRKLQPLGIGKGFDAPQWDTRTDGTGDRGGDRRDRRRRRRLVPGQLHRKRAGYRAFSAGRPGDEPGRESGDARRARWAGSPRSSREPNGQAVLHLAMQPAEMHLIPANVLVDITSPTVFGAKFVELVPPAEPSAQSLHAGQVLDSQHVTVEINTVFQRLTSVLDTLDPAKLNETLGALATAFSGRGEKIGQALSDLDSFLAKLDPSLTALSHDIAVLPAVANAYADAAPNLVKTAANATTISKTIVDEQRNLDALLISAIGLADIGNDVIGTNRKPLTDVLHLLVPTTDLTNAYNKALNCGFGGLAR